MHSCEITNCLIQFTERINVVTLKLTYVKSILLLFRPLPVIVKNGAQSFALDLCLQGTTWGQTYTTYDGER